MSAPTKIYYDDFAETVNREWIVGDTTYIRADIVDELVNILEDYLILPCELEGLEERARSALKKLEESHD